MTVLDVHQAWSWAVILGNATAGVWSLAAHWWAPFRRRALWWFVGLAELTILVQVVLGVWLLAGEGIDAPEFHVFYGFVSLLAVGLIYAYRNSMRANMYLLYGVGGLFLMGMGIRAAILA